MQRANQEVLRANQEAKNKLLFPAIQSGRLDQVRLLTHAQSHICKNSRGYIPLLYAILQNKWEIVDFLLSDLRKFATISPELKFELGKVIFICIDNENFPIRYKTNLINRLLTLGASPNIRYPETCETSLHRAAAGGYRDITLQLLEAGANIHEKSESGKIALELAIAGGHTECVKILASFKENKLMNLAVFALIFLTDEKNLFNLLPLEVIEKITNLFPKNPFLSIINLLSKSYNNVSCRLALISAKCALESYEKIGLFYVSLDTPLPSFSRSKKSIAFFTAVDKELSDHNKSIEEKVKAIKKNIEQYNPDKQDSNGLKLLHKFHLIPSQYAPVTPTPENQVKEFEDFYLVKKFSS